MCLYICCRSFNAKNMIFKESLVWTERDTGGEWDMNTSQIHLSVFYWISTLSCDSWVPVSFHPHSEHREERRWPQLYVPSPTGTSQSIRLLFFLFLCFFVLDEMWRCERTMERDKLFLISLFPPVIYVHHFLHSVIALHPNMSAGVHMGPECSSFFVHQTLSSSVSVSLFQTNRQSWMKNIYFFFFCMQWISLNVFVLSV